MNNQKEKMTRIALAPDEQEEMQRLIRLAIADYRKALSELDAFIEKGIRAGRFTREEAQANLNFTEVRASIYATDGGYLTALRAKRLFEKLVANEPEAVHTRLNGSLVLLHCGLVEAASREVDAILAVAPDNVEALAFAAFFARELKTGNADAFMERAKAIGSDSDAYKVLVEIYSEGGGFAELQRRAVVRPVDHLRFDDARLVEGLLNRLICTTCERVDIEKLEAVKKTLGLEALAPVFTGEESKASGEDVFSCDDFLGYTQGTVKLNGRAVRLLFPLNEAGVSALPRLWLDEVRRHLLKFVKSLDEKRSDALLAFEISPHRRVWAVFADSARATGAARLRREELYACRLFLAPPGLETMQALLNLEAPSSEELKEFVLGRRRIRALLSGSEADFHDEHASSIGADGVINILDIKAGMKQAVELVETYGMRGALAKLDTLPAAFRELAVFEYLKLVLIVNTADASDVDAMNRLMLETTITCGKFSDTKEYGRLIGLLFAKIERFGPAASCLQTARTTDQTDIDTLAGLYLALESFSSPDFAEPYRARIERFWREFEASEAELRRLLAEDNDNDALERMNVLAAPFNCNWGFQFPRLSPEKATLAFLPMGDRPLLLMMLELVRRCPDALKDRWSVIVGNPPIMLPQSITMFNVEMAIDRMTVWPQRSGEGYDFAIYSPDFERFPAEAEPRLHFLAQMVTRFAIGDAQTERWVKSCRAILSKDGCPKEAGISLEELGDYFREAEPASVDFDYEKLLQSPVSFWHKVSYPKSGFYFDVGPGETLCPSLMNEFLADEATDQNRFEFAGAVAGFVYFSFAEGEMSAERADAVREAFRSHVAREGVGIEHVRFIGRADGTRFGYLEFLAWDFRVLEKATASFFAAESALTASIREGGIKTYRQEGLPLEYRGDVVFEPLPEAELEKTESETEADSLEPIPAEFSGLEDPFMLRGRA